MMSDQGYRRVWSNGGIVIGRGMPNRPVEIPAAVSLHQPLCSSRVPKLDEFDKFANNCPSYKQPNGKLSFCFHDLFVNTFVLGYT